MPLTDTAIKNAKPSDKTARMFDGGGMYLEISPAGGKWWRLKYRYDGKEKRLVVVVLVCGAGMWRLNLPKSMMLLFIMRVARWVKIV